MDGSGWQCWWCGLHTTLVGGVVVSETTEKVRTVSASDVTLPTKFETFMRLHVVK